MPLPERDVPTVGLVGLGVIGRVHLDVLASEPRVALAFVADPRLGSAGAASPPAGCPAYGGLSEALESVERGEIAEPDVIVLATPTSTHLDLAAEVLQRTAATVLSEKPLTGDAGELASFESRHVDASERVRVVNHFAFSPEVGWAVGQVEQRGWAAPTTVLSSFNDPYVKKSVAERSTYVSSWIDSGPNQLGLLARFVSSPVVQVHRATPDGTRSMTELDHEGGSAVLVTNWATGDSSKQTSLRWSDGCEILLDHTAMTGVALERGKPVAHFGGTGMIDRKTAHYAAMYDSYLTDPASPLLSWTFARSSAALLHAAAASEPPVQSVDWDTAPR